METCANTYYLNKYLDEQDKAEEAVEYFRNCVQEEIGHIEELASYYIKGCKLLDEAHQEVLFELLTDEAQSLADEIYSTACSHSNEYGYEFTDEAKELINEFKGDLDL